MVVKQIYLVLSIRNVTARSMGRCVVNVDLEPKREAGRKEYKFGEVLLYLFLWLVMYE